jgi:hypothetical protein
VPGYIRDGGVWKQVKTIYVRDGGVWKAAKAAFVRDAGAWKPFFSSLFATSINIDAANVNLRTVANAAGYGGSGDCTVTLNAEAYSANGAPALVPGVWAAGITLTLIIAAGRFISGMGGPGGNGYANSALRPTAGGPGGTALDASGVAGFTFAVQNLGTLRGGGGGGAGGGGGMDGYTDPSSAFNGGGGGGGQGRNGGRGGLSGRFIGNQFTDPNATIPDTSGGSGSPAGPGAGGHSESDGSTFGVGWAGGNGGAWGTPGGAPSGGPVGDINFDGPRTGGAAGKAVNGNANILWIATGTRLGPIT